jgi:hypothetical protein
MIRGVLFLVAVLCFLGNAQAQLVISVDTALSRNHGKSLSSAIGFSALVPGMGQKYLGESQAVKKFVWVDAAGFSAVLVGYMAGQSYLASAQAFASHHAGIVNPPRDPTFLDVVARYRSRSGPAGQNSNPDLAENYDMSLIRSGKSVDDLYASDPSHTWDWGSSDNPETTARMREYNDILQRYRFSKVIFQVAVGMVVLNRIVSVFDVLRIFRATSGGPLVLDVQPIWSPQNAGLDLQVGF